MWWDRLLDPFRGKAVTIPPFDGAFKPNNRLEEAPVVARLGAPDSLAVLDGHLVAASGTKLVRVAGGVADVLRDFERPITAMTGLADGGLAVALGDGTIVLVGGARDGRIVTGAKSHGASSITALAAQGPDVLLVAIGSAVRSAGDWVVALMEGGATGTVLRIDLETGEVARLADGLAWPFGILVEADHSILVAEAFRHRLVRVSPDGRGGVEPVLSKLPGYPARLSGTADGGALLALFAPRNRLVEFVLQEPGYRAEMMRSVERPYWIAPALSAQEAFLEPLQCGGVRTMGIHKPWSPSRSYGLVVKLDPALQPVASWHSRADGRRHGVTHAIEHEGRLLAAAKGGDVVVELSEEAR